MNRIFVIAISVAFASMAHAQAASHSNAAPRVNKTPSNATVSHPGVPATSTNSTHTGNTAPAKTNGVACFQGSGAKDNPTSSPCRHVKTGQM